MAPKMGPSWGPRRAQDGPRRVSKRWPKPQGLQNDVSAVFFALFGHVRSRKRPQMLLKPWVFACFSSSTLPRFFAQDGQLGAQNGLSCGPRRVQDGPKTASKRLQDGIENELRKQARVGSLSGPTWGPRWGHLGPTWGPRWGHLGAQDGPKRAQEGTKNRFNFVSGLGFDFGPTWGPKWANLGPKMGQLGAQKQLVLQIRPQNA